MFGISWLDISSHAGHCGHCVGHCGNCVGHCGHCVGAFIDSVAAVANADVADVVFAVVASPAVIVSVVVLREGEVLSAIVSIHGLFVFSSHIAIDGHGGQDDRVGDDDVVAPCGYSGDFEAICPIVASGLRLSGLPIMLHVFNASVVFT